MQVELHAIAAPEKPINLAHNVRWMAFCDVAGPSDFLVTIWTVDEKHKKTVGIKAKSDYEAVHLVAEDFVAEVLALEGGG